MVYSNQMSKKILLPLLACLCWANVVAQHGGGGEKFTLEQKYNAQAAQNFVKLSYDANNIANLKRQMAAWQAVVGEEPQNANYWFNYYMVARLYYVQTGGGDITADKQQLLSGIAKRMDSAVNTKTAKSFEKLLIAYFEEEDFEKGAKNLMAAAKINPNHPFLPPEMAKYFAFTGNNEELQKWLNKIPEISDKTAIYQYTKAMLATLPNEAMLVTNGEYDTYALWKALHGTAKKIQVVSLKMLESEQYRTQLVSRGVVMPTFSIYNKSDALKQLLEKNTNAQVYVSLTVQPTSLGKKESSLYNTGLVYYYSPQAFQNLDVLYKNLVEDEVKATIPTYNNEIFKNLMPGYILLYREIALDRKASVRDKAKSIAEKAGFWGDYKKYFE